jgi:hypothetical protein
MISREYGKITGWWNKKNITGIDLWDIVEVLISRDGSKNTIKSVDILTPGWSKNWSYARIIAFLDTLNIVNKMSIEGNECRSLYGDTEKLITYGRSQDMNPWHHVVFQMRILKTLGSMDRGMLWDDPILIYIYDHISHTPLERILSFSNVRIEHIAKIQQINLHSLYMLER